MYRLILLISVAIWHCIVCDAQQTTDSTGQPHPDSISSASSLFSAFSCSTSVLNSVRLQWKADSVSEGGYFIVERSNDGNNYETIGALKINIQSSEYELTDVSPKNGHGYYRVKYTDKQGSSYYSRNLQVNISAEVDFKFYPNPADKVLIIQASHNIDLQILDGSGTVRLNKSFLPGMQVINISFLEKGSYVLHIADRDSNKAVSEQLLKN